VQTSGPHTPGDPEGLGRLVIYDYGMMGRIQPQVTSTRLTLNPNSKPSTLNPQPSTLNPQPSTLNPIP